MALQAGTRIGPYEVIGQIGAGGMGEVYRATDINLTRQVAIKVLPDTFANDPERLARFAREAKTLAALNHPNIAQIYGLEKADPSTSSGQAGVRALVMELVEGPTLADRIAQSPIPVDEALPIVKQIAEALEAAHEQGIIHRDLKPANIKVRPDGTVKVLDFGLAKALEPSSASGVDATASPTITSPAMMTGVGVLLGTAAYMSPEQAKGKPADKRSDIWAFGCVLYEMLAGRRAFHGETVGETFASILKEEPDWRRLPANLAESIHRLLRRCLNKDPRLRLQHIGDARIEIDQPGISLATERVPQHKERLVWTAGLAFVVVISVLLGARAFRAQPNPPEMRLDVVTPPTTDPVSLAMSPDGEKLAFVAMNGGRLALWVRPLNAASAQPLEGTDGARHPFWSPDSRSVGFFADGRVKRVDVDSGSVQIVSDAVVGRGGAWSPDGYILFTSAMNSPVFRVSAKGGERTAVTQLKDHEVGHRFPQLVPDGRHFLYFAGGSSAPLGVYVSRIDGSEARHLLDSDTVALYTSGRLLFIRQGTLFAQPFDAERLELTGNPVPVAANVAFDPLGYGAVGASAAGSIVYRTGSGYGRRQFVWFDRAGAQLATLGGPDDANAVNPSLSPDGRRVALSRTQSGGRGTSDIWIMDTVRGVLNRLTSDPAMEIVPIWSPNGSRIVFNGIRNGQLDLIEQAVTDTEGEKALRATAGNKTPTDWSSDGRYLLYHVGTSPGFDIWALPMNGEGMPFPVAQTKFSELQGQFSPDGKWIAYQSDETGRFEIYVQPFPGPGSRERISIDGGAQVRWRRDGKELFFIALDGRLMSAPIQLDSAAGVVRPGMPVPLFTTRVGGAVQGVNTQQYVVSADGERFLMNTMMEDTSASAITVLLNWKP